MIKSRLKKKLIEEISKVGNVWFSCSKLGIGRATYYRWKEKCPSFKIEAEEAECLGRQNMGDIADAALLKNVKNGSQRAIEYALGHNSERYRYENKKSPNVELNRIIDESSESLAETLRIIRELHIEREKLNKEISEFERQKKQI